MLPDENITVIMSKPVIKINKNTTLTEIKQSFSNNNLHHLPVIDNGNVVGIVTSQDVHVAEIINNKIEKNFDESKVLAEEIMSNKLVSIKDNATVKIAAEYFIKHKVHCLPVLNNNNDLVGIITTYDLIKYLSQVI